MKYTNKHQGSNKNVPLTVYSCQSQLNLNNSYSTVSTEQEGLFTFSICWPTVRDFQWTTIVFYHVLVHGQQIWSSKKKKQKVLACFEICKLSDSTICNPKLVLTKLHYGEVSKWASSPRAIHCIYTFHLYHIIFSCFLSFSTMWWRQKKVTFLLCFGNSTKELY